MIRVCEDATAVARAAAERVVAVGVEALARRGAFRLGVSGGRTPEALYRLLGEEPFCGAVAWSRVDVLFADERAVPPDDSASNCRLVRDTLVAATGIPEARVHPMRGDEPDLETAAADYDALLEEPLDLLLLGIGEDGHTASLFPGSPLLAERARRVAVVHDSPKPPARRLTVTPRVIAEARDVLVLATGHGKAPAVTAALEGAASVAECPAILLRDRNWLLDQEAASGLRQR